MNPKVASRLVWTVLAPRLVPAVIVHERYDDKLGRMVLDVLDGKQRLTTLYVFQKG